MSLGFFGFMRDLLLKHTNIVTGNDEMMEIAFTFSPFIIAPLLLIFGYKYVFHYPTRKFVLVVASVTVLLLVSLNLFSFHLDFFRDHSNI